MSILIRFCLRKGSKVMRKLLKRFLDRMVAWMRRKIDEDTISEKESEKMWRDIKKFLEENRVKK